MIYEKLVYMKMFLGERERERERESEREREREREGDCSRIATRCLIYYILYLVILTEIF